MYQESLSTCINKTYFIHMAPTTAVPRADLAEYQQHSKSRRSTEQPSSIKQQNVGQCAEP
jgi:hypothetical protein